MAKKAGIAGWLTEIFSVPAEAFSGTPRIMVTGARRVLVENHRGLLRYESDIIEISGGKVMLRVRGEDMELVVMRRSDMLIEGTIFSAEFE